MAACLLFRDWYSSIFFSYFSLDTISILEDAPPPQAENNIPKAIANPHSFILKVPIVSYYY